MSVKTKVEVIVGSMSSGKTSELGRRLERHLIAKRRIMVFKPEIDTRYGENVLTDRNRFYIFEAKNLPVDLTEEILEEVVELSDQYDVISFDEVQFFNERIVPLVQKLRKKGKIVLLCGLDMDFRGEPFGHIGPLMSIACDVTKLHAVCKGCGRDATVTQRLIAGEPAPEGETVRVGDVDSQEEESHTYEARCWDCYVHPSKVQPK